MKCFSIDESGYTGFDLLNAEQRFQGACALSIAQDEAARLIATHFPKLQAPELKFSQLARRPGNRPRLLALQRDVLAQCACVTYVCDKRFLLILMFVDYAVEPVYYAAGVDFYKDGQNFSMACMLYFAGPALLGERAFDALLAAFQAAVKEKSRQAWRELVRAAKRTRWQELPYVLEPLVNGATPLREAINVPGVSTDAAFVVLQALISRTEVIAGAPYRIEHDRSRNLTRYHEVLQRYIGHEQTASFQQSQITNLSFPLKLTEVTQVDSKDSPAVQLADVMVGAAMEAAGGQGTPEDIAAANEVFGQYDKEQFIYLMPDIDFAEQKRFRQGAQSSQLIDYFAKHFAAQWPT